VAQAAPLQQWSSSSGPMAFPAEGGRFFSCLLVSCGLLAESVVVDNKGLGNVAVNDGELGTSFVELGSAKLQPGALLRVDEEHRVSLVDFEFYRFSLSEGTLELDDLYLYDELSQTLDLTDQQTLLQARLGGPEVLSNSGDVAPCVDGKSDTRCHLDAGQNIVLKLAPGRPVSAYGFTVVNISGTAAIPVDFSMAGSADGSTWRNLSVKHSVTLPNGGSAGLMVGPFVLLDLTGQAASRSSGSEARWATETHPAKVEAVDLTTPAPVHLAFTSTVPPPPATSTAAPAAAQRVAEAVMKASEHSQLPVPEELASAAAAGAAAADRPEGSLSPEAIAEVAKGTGVSTPILQRLKSSLKAVDCKYYGAIMAMWNSASLARDGTDVAIKVKKVVTVSADAGFSVEQQAQAGAAAAAAGLASLTTEGPSGVIAEVLRASDAAGLDLEMQTRMAAVLETQSSQQQAALLMLLKAAVLSTTTDSATYSEPTYHTATGAAKLVGEEVAQAVASLDVDPQTKLQVISAAAAAAQEAEGHSSTTTSFDGVKLVVDAAQDAGIKDIGKLRKVQEEARIMTPDQQKAAARSLEAAGAGRPFADVTTTTRGPATAADTVEKVSEVVKAAAAAGMSEEQQASVAATAVVAASPAAQAAAGSAVSASATVQEPGLTKLVEAAKGLGLSTEQQDALLSAVTNDVEAVDAIRRTMAAAGVAGR